MFILAGSGHIAGIINPDNSNKYGYWVNNKKYIMLRNGLINLLIKMVLGGTNGMTGKKSFLGTRLQIKLLK